MTGSEERILYHHRTQGKGVEGVHIRGMIEGFNEQGFKVDIVEPPGVFACRDEKSPPKKADDPRTRLWHQVAGHLPQLAFEALEWAYNVYSYRKLREKLTGNSYRFLYERYALNSFSAACLSGKYGVPYLLEVNDATVIERSRRLVAFRTAQAVEKRVFDRADLIITISHHFKKRIAEGHRIPRDQILVLPNAISPERFELKPQCRLSKKALGIHHRYVVGCAGAFVPWHGLGFLLSAVHDVLKEMDVFVLLIGDGPVRGEVEQMAKELDIAGRVRFTGFVDVRAVTKYLDVLDVFIIPDSNRHCSPMKLFEAMAMGKAIVLPRYEPLEEVITEGHDGKFFKPGDAEGLRCSLVELLCDSETRKSMGSRARKTALENHTWTRNAETLLEVLRERVKR